MILEPLQDWFFGGGWRILLIVIIAVLVYYLVHHFAPIIIRSALIQRLSNKPEEDVIKRVRTLSTVIINTGLVVIGTISLFTILGELGIDIGPALAGIGIAGIAIGFGAQSLVKDFLSGLFIVLENHFSVGDVVSIADVSGIVEEMNLRRTVIRDLDGIVHVVPNGEIRVANNLTREWSRVNMNVEVGYNEDLDRVISVINRVGNELAEDPQWEPLIIKAPQVLRVDSFDDSGIAIKILGETKPIRQWDVMGEMRLRIKREFDRENIEIPWPHTKVYFGNSPTR